MNKSPCLTGIVHLSDLPDNLYIKSSKLSEMVYLAEKVARSGKKLAKRANVSYNPLNGKVPRSYPKSIGFIRRICEFLNENSYGQFSLDNLEKEVFILKTASGKAIINPKLPFNFNSKEGAAFIGAVLHDGCIQDNHTVKYTNLRAELRNRFKEVSNKLFGDVNIYLGKYTVELPTVIGYILSSLGMKIGKKSIANIHIPPFLFNSKESTIAQYLDFAFSDDGCVIMNLKHSTYALGIALSMDVTDLQEKLRIQIKSNPTSYQQYATRLIRECKILLNKLDIKTNGPNLERERRYVDKRDNKLHIVHHWGLRITNLSNIEKFFEKITLTHEEKKQKLQEIIRIAKNIPYRLTRKHEVFDTFLPCCISLEEKDGEVRASSFSKHINRSLGRTQWILKRMVEQGLLDKIGETPHNCEFIYRVTKK